MLRIGIAPSPTLATMLVVVHLIAGTCVFVFLSVWWAVAILNTALFASLVFHLRRDALRLSDDAVIEVTLRDQGRCQLMTRGGALIEGTVARSSFVSGWLTVVNVRDAGRRLQSVVVTPDCAAAEDRRRLRVWLRHRAHRDMTNSSFL